MIPFADVVDIVKLAAGATLVVGLVGGAVLHRLRSHSVRWLLGGLAVVTVLSVLAAVLVGCADSDSSDSSSSPSPSTADASSATTVGAAALDGRSYASTSVEGAELVEGTTIEVGFEGETMSSIWRAANETTSS